MRGVIDRGNTAYRRGMILGLTMAEIVLLLIFSLLLTLATMFALKQKELKETEIELARLQKVVNEMSKNDFAKIAAELVRLRDEQDAIRKILERFESAAPLPEKIEQLIEKASRHDKFEKLIKDVGLSGSPEKLAEELDRLIKADEETRALRERNGRLIRQNEMLSQKIDQMEGQLSNQQRMLERAGKGTEMPACWADKITGKPKYMYNVGLTNQGLIVRKSEYPPWASSRELPVDKVVLNQELSPGSFLRVTSPILEWSKKNECRFFVRSFDLTGSTEKRLYKTHMRYLETSFYQYEVLDDPWPAN